MPTGVVLVLAEAGDEGIAAVRHGEPRAERAAGSAHDHPFRGAEELHLWPPASACRYVMGTRSGTPDARQARHGGWEGGVGTHRISGFGDVLHDEVSLHEVHDRDGFLLGFGVRRRGR